MDEAYVKCTSPDDASLDWKPLKRLAVNSDIQLPNELKSQFALPSKVIYTQQYASIYYCRIRQLRPIITKRVKKILEKEGLDIPVYGKTIDAIPDKECVIIGTLFKDMPLKPCVLDEYDKDELDAAKAELAARANLVSPEDTLALEDEHGRVVLMPAPTCRIHVTSDEVISPESASEAGPSFVRVSDMVSGAVIAVQGKENDLGEFEIHRVFFPEVPEVKQKGKAECDLSAPVIAPSLRKGARYVAFVSDIGLGNPKLSMPLQAKDQALAISNPKDFVPSLVLAREGQSVEEKSKAMDNFEGTSLTPEQALDLCVDYLLGLAGSPSDAEIISARIEGIVFAGNSLYQPPVEVITDVVDTVRAQKLAEIERKHIIETSTKQLDVLCSELASAMEVKLIPGARDPSRHNWPQPPIHHFILPRASAFSSFELLSNPAIFSSSGLIMTGHDGLATKDICRLSSLEVLDALENTLRWRHIVPTAPDTIGCYPFDGVDPFVLRERPQVYFAGDQKVFAARRIGPPNSKLLHEQCLLLSIPSFSKTATIVLVDVETLQAIPMSFGMTMIDKEESNYEQGQKRERE